MSQHNCRKFGVQTLNLFLLSLFISLISKASSQPSLELDSEHVGLTDFRNELKALRDEVDELVALRQEVRQLAAENLSAELPIGTISAWVPRVNGTTGSTMTLPDGWLYCDGRPITKGPWTGGRTPDLNTAGHFLRGGSEDQALELQEDEIKDHKHQDHGHTHRSYPHNHGFYDIYTRGDHYEDDDSNFWFGNNIRETRSQTNDETVQIKEAYSNIGFVQNWYNPGNETRPRNMKVVWIIKVSSTNNNDNSIDEL